MLTTLITILAVLAGVAFLPAPILVTTAIALIASLSLWGFGGALVWSVLVENQTPAAWGVFYLDRLGGFFLAVLVLIGGAVLLNVAGQLRTAAAGGSQPAAASAAHGGNVPFSVSLGLTLLFLLFMMLGLCSRNLGLIWVCVEGTTMVSALLIGFEHQRTALEAAWKYIILCTVGLSFSLLGLILLVFAADIAGAVPTLDPVGLAVLAPQLPPTLLKLAFLLILVGFGTKAGFAPLHSWLPDAHSQAPAPTSALLSAVLLNCSVYAIIRAAGVLSAAGLGGEVRSGLLLFGFLSVALAALFLLVQHDLKRMLAYSSIEHIGLITLGIGIGTPLSVFAALVHTITHSLSKALAFLSAGELVREAHSHEMNRMLGMLRRRPAAASGFGVAMTGLAGMPPWPIFASELLLVWAALAAGRVWLAIGLLLLLATAFTGLLYHTVRVVFGDDPFHHWHHHKDGTGHHAEPEVPDRVPVKRESGLVWRDLSIAVLVFMVTTTPLLLLTPVAGVIRAVAAVIPGGAQ